MISNILCNDFKSFILSIFIVVYLREKYNNILGIVLQQSFLSNEEKGSVSQFLIIYRERWEVRHESLMGKIRDQFIFIFLVVILGIVRGIDYKLAASFPISSDIVLDIAV